MADSDNTMPMALVTRRRALAGALAVASAGRPSDHAAGAEGASEGPDPALTLWRKWRVAWSRMQRLCRKQQRLETRLAITVGFPRASVSLPDGETVTVSSIEALDEVLGDDPGTFVIRAKAEADFAAHQARWGAADAELGYSAALRAEAEAAALEQKQADKLSSTRATTLAGVAGKLDAVLRLGETTDHCTDFPWPQIRAALGDLMRIAQLRSRVQNRRP